MRLTEKTENGYYLVHETKGSMTLLDIQQMKSETNNLILKLGELEDIEDELGIDLITLFKGLKDGIYCYDKIYRKYCDGFDTIYNPKNKPLVLLSSDKRKNVKIYGFIKKEQVMIGQDCLIYTKNNLVSGFSFGMQYDVVSYKLYFKDYGKTWALTKEELL